MKNMDMANANKNRHYGIDALRIVSMFMIVLMHLLMNGGVIDENPRLDLNYYAASLLEAIAFPACNCFALISGYMGAQSKPRYSRLALLWICVVLYSFGISAISFVIFPGVVSIKQLLYSLLPAVTEQYWYFSAYFALFLFMPLLNAGIQRLSCRQLEGTLGMGFLAFCCLSVALRLDGFHLRRGYSALWLIYLHVLGGYLRRYDVLRRVRTAVLALIWTGATLASWLSVPIIHVVTLRFSGVAHDVALLFKYTSPPMVVAAVCVLALFERWQPSPPLRKVISFAAPLSFSVYLIHAHPVLFDHWMHGRFAPLADKPLPALLFELLLTAVAIFVLSCAIDWLRLRLFTALRLKERLEALIDDRLLKSPEE